MEAYEYHKIDLRTPFEENYEAIEAYKSFRTNLMFCGSDKRVLAITSCMPNEGKSTLAMGLARSIAEIGKTVLLIDADMRKSLMYSQYADGTHEIGLSHYLSGQAEKKDAIVTTQYPGLHVIFAGIYPPNPVELLGSESFRQLLASAREEYDYVLVDLPPIGAVIDAAVVAKNCDGVIMVLASGRIGLRVAKGCKEQLEKSGAPILGAVLNMTSHRSGKYYKKYYTYYGKYYRGYYGKNEKGKKKKS